MPRLPDTAHNLAKKLVRGGRPADLVRLCLEGDTLPAADLARLSVPPIRSVEVGRWGGLKITTHPTAALAAALLVYERQAASDTPADDVAFERLLSALYEVGGKL